jgi:CO/xanthine dehydrogenase FAD-binding subunit
MSWFYFHIKNTVGLKSQLLKPILHFLEMKIQRAKFFEFALLEMFRHVGVGFQDFEEIRVVASGVFDLPRFHRGVLHELVSRFARQAFLMSASKTVCEFHMPSERPRFFFMFAG